MNVYGVRLTEVLFRQNFDQTAVELTDTTPPTPTTAQPRQIPAITSAQIPQAQPPASGDAETGILETTGVAVEEAADKFDRVDAAVTAVTSRTDAAKSLWTTVLGAICQAVWAVFGFIAGLPREVWIVVAVIAAVLMILYLYRQITLGKIRERTTPAEAATPPS